MKRNFKKSLSVVLAMIMLLSSGCISAFAADGKRVTRTTALDLTLFDYSVDQANESEGWSWDAETFNLTLDNVNIDVASGPAILLPHDVAVNIVLVGDNYVKSVTGNATICSKKGYSKLYSISGDNLTIDSQSPFGAITATSFTVESGTITTNGTITAQDITINGGSLNINTLEKESSDAYCLYALHKITINGGTHTIRSSEIAVVSQSDEMTGSPGIEITGGDLIIEGHVAATYTGVTGRADTVINSDGTVIIENSGIGFYSQDGDILVEKGNVKAVNTPEDKLFRVGSPETDVIRIADADYSAVDSAIEKIPQNLDDYTEESAQALNNAVNAVERELLCIDQYIVDDYAKAIEEAVEGLEELTFWQKVELFFTNLFGGDGESDGECWLVKIFKAIINFFVNIFNTVIGFFR